MTAFDPERYLRKLAARTVADQRSVQARSPLLAAAQALVAAGCVEEPVAQRVLDDHEAELRRRDRERAMSWKRAWPRAPFAHRRVALGEGEVADATQAIRIRYVVFAPDATEIAVSVRHSGRPRSARTDGPSGVRVAGARGKRVSAGFSGSSSSEGWAGVLHCHPPLNEATSAIEIDGLRPGLASVPSHVDVSVEALPPAHAALRHLWHIAALTGLTGPDRTIAVGAVTPLFDGVAVVVDALESSAQQWSISVEFAPEGASPHPFEAPTARLVSLVWWATDDRGNRYLAAPGALGGNADGGRGQLTFDAPLDPRARWIELRPTTEASRAVMRIPLD